MFNESEPCHACVDDIVVEVKSGNPVALEQCKCFDKSKKINRRDNLNDFDSWFEDTHGPIDQGESEPNYHKNTGGADRWKKN